MKKVVGWEERVCIGRLGRRGQLQTVVWVNLSYLQVSLGLGGGGLIISRPRLDNSNNASISRCFFCSSNNARTAELLSVLFRMTAGAWDLDLSNLYKSNIQVDISLDPSLKPKSKQDARKVSGLYFLFYTSYFFCSSSSCFFCISSYRFLFAIFSAALAAFSLSLTKKAFPPARLYHFTAFS